MVLYWLQIPIREESQKLWLGTGAPILRASGLVADTAAFGHLIAVWALVTLGSLWIDNRSNRIALTVLVSGFVLYALAASSSRAALLDILGGLFTFCLLNRGARLVHRNRAIVGMLLGSAALTVVLAWLLLASNSQRTGAIEGSLTRFLGGGDTSINSFSSGRLDSWTSYLSQCGDYLVAGTGYKTATFVLPGKFPDNAFLGITVEVGIPGLVCMLFFIGSVFCGLIGQRRAGNPYAALVLALWVGQLLHAMTADSFTSVFDDALRLFADGARFAGGSCLLHHTERGARFRPGAKGSFVMRSQPLNVGIIHEWLSSVGGSERVVEQFLQLYPDSQLYTTVDFLPEQERGMLGGRPVKTTFIQRMPFARKHFRGYLPLMPLAVEQHDLAEHDVIISSNHAVAKGVITRPGQLHVCYIHTPMRVRVGHAGAVSADGRPDEDAQGNGRADGPALLADVGLPGRQAGGCVCREQPVRGRTRA